MANRICFQGYTALVDNLEPFFPQDASLEELIEDEEEETFAPEDNVSINVMCFDGYVCNGTCCYDHRGSSYCCPYADGVCCGETGQCCAPGNKCMGVDKKGAICAKKDEVNSTLPIFI